ncbi:MAG: DUF3857 and transglutaminase domain-containing protein [Proteobacteria bacterium]|nr:DUF3857 and transglutaminase domain-containing protein [Pseudomonadota bacterium]
MRTFVVAGLLLMAAAVIPASSQTVQLGTASTDPSFEIVKQHVDIEISTDGTFYEADEMAFRVLNEQGRHGLQQMTLTNTQGYETTQIKSAYTLKPNGTRLDVPPGQILYGRGASTGPGGFDDLQTMTVVYPNVEIGDEVVLVTLFHQDRPWFGTHFAREFNFSRSVLAHDVRITLSVPANVSAPSIDASGLEGGARETYGDKYRWVWTYKNDISIPLAADSVAESDFGPHLHVSSFRDYAAVAQVYDDIFRERSGTTPEIRQLADQLTAGIADRREQAHALYDWVAGHIAYVNIVLGAGGFVPHEAQDVLRNRYGDCKDHVILLQALLWAKGIQSSPVLINAGNGFQLSKVPSTYLFNHLITYVPEFQMYLDSTARTASFGVLPFADAGKPVVIVTSGKVDRTPSITANGSTMRVMETLKVTETGDVEGDTQVTATGVAAQEMREIVTAIPATKEADYFRLYLGPGAEGTLTRGEPMKLAPTYVFGAHYRIPSVATIPGPAAMPPWIGYKPFFFTDLLAGSLPPTRTSPYLCGSFDAEEIVTITFPQGTEVTTLPRPVDFHVQDIAMSLTYDQPAPNIVHATTKLRTEHPQATCTPEYYAKIEPDLRRAVGQLRGQLLYK